MTNKLPAIFLIMHLGARLLVRLKIELKSLLKRSNVIVILSQMSLKLIEYRCYFHKNF